MAAGELAEQQQESAEAARDIPGWLRPEDIAKLYELSYRTPGPILEIGCHHGKSTVIIASALADRDLAVPFVSLDVSPSCLRAAARNLTDRRLADRVVLVRGSARACLRAIPNLRPALVFVDGDHTYDGVRRDLAALQARIPNAGALLLHDYGDPGNADPGRPDLGVVRAVRESWVARECEFAGVFGVCGLFVRRSGGPSGPASDQGSPPIVDAVLRDSPRLQYLQRVRWPLGRWLRELRARR